MEGVEQEALTITLAPVPRKAGPDRWRKTISERAEAAAVRSSEKPEPEQWFGAEGHQEEDPGAIRTIAAAGPNPCHSSPICSSASVRESVPAEEGIR